MRLVRPLKRVAGALLLVSAGAVASDAPVRVVDDTGREVVLARPAARIISLAPHLTEILFDLGVGEHVVGTVQYSDFPAAAKTIPRLGDAFSVNVEALMALAPDIVFAWRTGGSNRALEKLEALGVPIYFNEAPRLEDIGPGVIKMSALVGRRSVGEQLAAQFDAAIASYRFDRPQGEKVVVFFQISDQDLYTVNDDHLIGQALGLCGASNLFGQVKAPVPLVSKEAVVAGAPDLIIMTRIPGAPLSSWAHEWTKFGIDPGRIVSIDPNLISRPGLRMQAGIAQLCSLVAQAGKRQTETRPATESATVSATTGG